MIVGSIVDPDSLLSSMSSSMLLLVAAGATSQGSPGRSSTPILPSVWCELSSSTRAQGGAGQSLDGPHLFAQPLLCQRLEEKRRPGAAQPSVGTLVLSPWPGRCSSSYSSFTAQVGTSHMDTGCSPQHPPSAQNPEFWFPFLAKSVKGVCVCRFPVPACAHSATLPLCISGNNSQTHLHPEQWLQCWRLPYILVPAETRDLSHVSTEILLRLR